MKKALILSILLGLFTGGLFSQNYLNRHPFDFKKFNLGLQLGLTYNAYNLKEQVNIIDRNDTLQSIRLQSKPGMHFGMITNFSLSPRVSLRLVPSISLEQRNIYYLVKRGENIERETRKIDPSYVDIPFMLQWKTSYWRRLRFYVLTGGQVSVNLVRTSKVKDDPNLIKLTRTDAALILGFGTNMYGDKVKFSPEIRYKLGLRNVYVPDNTRFADAIARLSSQVISINFNFE